MNKLFTILACMALLAFAEGAFCGAPELVKLLESRKFWSSYPWERYEDSALYRSTTWSHVGTAGRGDVKTRDDFTAPLIIDNLPVQAVNMYVDAETREATGFDIYSHNGATNDDYHAFVNWCTARFGPPEREMENVENLGSVTRTSITSFWTIDNTRVTVRTENNLSNGPASVGFITTLSFTKQYRPSITDTTVTTGKLPDTPPDTQPVAPRVIHRVPQAAPRNEPQRRVESVPALSTTARPGATRPAMPGSGRLPAAAAPTEARPAAMERYQPPPYIWEDRDGAVTATNDMADVPEEVRPRFELQR